MIIEKELVPRLLETIDILNRNLINDQKGMEMIEIKVDCIIETALYIKKLLTDEEASFIKSR